MTKIVLFFIFPNIFNFFLKLFCDLIKLIIFVKIITMKTTIMELIEFIKNYKNQSNFNADLVINILEIALEKEKEQIIEAHGDKYRGGFNSSGAYFNTKTTGEEYYNQTYNQNK